MKENEFFFLRSCSDPDELANLFISKWNEKNVFIIEHPFRNWEEQRKHVSYASYFNAYHNISNNINKIRKYEHKIGMVGARRREKKTCEYFQISQHVARIRCSVQRIK